jgi:hypothetical protein
MLTMNVLCPDAREVSHASRLSGFQYKLASTLLPGV